MVGDPQAAGLLDLSTPAFVGREREVAVLRQALSRPPAVVLVEGEPGGGKSRLVREFLAAQDEASRGLLLAVCPPFREALTLGPIVDAIRQAHDNLLGLQLSGLAGALRPLFPEWTDSLPPLPAPLEDAKAARHRLLRALGELLAAAEVAGLVLEDAHWADPVTLEFLLYLASRPRASAPSLVVTYRPEEVPAGSLLRRLWSRLPAGTTQVRVGLPPLDLAATAGMAASMLYGGRLAPGFAEFLHERTGGVPLAVEESVRLLRDRADLAREDGEWVRRSTDELRLSPTIRESVRERVQRLGDPAQRVLRAAAVLGDVIEPSILAEVAGLPPAAAERALAEAVASGLLREGGRSRPTFRHVFLRQAVYETIPGADRRRLHRRAGHSLEAAYPPAVAQLTRHFREANEVSLWCRYAEQAAARALASGDRTTATLLLNELLATAELPPATRVRLAAQLGTAAVDRGTDVDDLHRQVVQTMRQVLASEPDLDPPDPRTQAEIRSLLGRLLTQQGDLAAAQVELERAIPHLQHNPAQAARAMTYLGCPLVGRWPAAEHLRWLARAAEVEPRVMSLVDRVALTVDRATALLQLGEEEGWAVASTLPAAAPTGELPAGARQQLGRGCLNIGYAAIVWGRYQEARVRLEQGLKLTEADGCRRLHTKLSSALAELDWLTGAWDGLAARATTELEADVVDPTNRLLLSRLVGRLHAAAGARRKAEAYFGMALREAPQRGVFDLVLGPAAALARLRLADGQVEEALRVTEEPMDTVASKQIWVWATEIAPARLDALLAAGRSMEAADLVAGYARGLRGRRAPAARAGLATCRAALAARHGPVPAAAAYARAAQAWERLPRPYDALLTRERQAHGLLAAGQAEAGLALLREIQSGLSDLGAPGDADRVALELRQHGVDVRRPWRGGRRGYGSQMSPRELDVVRLVLAGKTNREIAEALCKSPRTVAGQLGSVMRKLGVSSRTELAVRVVEAGISADLGLVVGDISGIPDLSATTTSRSAEECLDGWQT